MISVMTVQITSLAQRLTNGGVAVASGTLEFSNYSNDGDTRTELGFESSYGSAAFALMNAEVGYNGVAVGFIDNINKTPIFKINSFVPVSLPATVVDFEEEAVTIPFK